MSDGSEERPLVSIDDLAVELGNETILESLSMRADRGSLVGLIGPNGAGKTTLLRAIDGVLEPAAGRITIDGRDVGDCSARELGRLVATVPQSTALSFSFSVRETVQMGRHPHVSRFGSLTPTDLEAVEEAMAATEVQQFAGRSITEVSGGERQRVILARALAQQTPLLLLDEPTASLDINHAVRTLELVRGIVDGGDRGAIAAIHDLDLAARYCDELVLLADGSIVDRGPPRAVLSSDALGEAFETDAVAGVDSVTGTPRVTALADRPGRDRSVHVVGTGDLARRTIVELADAGFGGTTGLVPATDVAAETADRRGFEPIEVPPLAGVTNPAIDRAAEAAAAADLLVVVGTPSDSNRQVLRRAVGDTADRHPPTIGVREESIDPTATKPGGGSDRSGAATDGGAIESLSIDRWCLPGELVGTIDEMIE